MNKDIGLRCDESKSKCMQLKWKKCHKTVLVLSYYAYILGHVYCRTIRNTSCRICVDPSYVTNLQLFQTKILSGEISLVSLINIYLYLYIQVYTLQYWNY